MYFCFVFNCPGLNNKILSTLPRVSMLVLIELYALYVYLNGLNPCVCVSRPMVIQFIPASIWPKKFHVAWDFQASSPTSWPTRSSAGPTTRSWVSSSWPLRCPLSRCPCTPTWSSGSGSALTGPSLRPPSGARYDYKLSLFEQLHQLPKPLALPVKVVRFIS